MPESASCPLELHSNPGCLSLCRRAVQQVARLRPECECRTGDHLNLQNCRAEIVALTSVTFQERASPLPARLLHANGSNFQALADRKCRLVLSLHNQIA